MMFQSDFEGRAYPNRQAFRGSPFGPSEVERVSMKTWWTNGPADFGCHRGNRMDILTGGRPRMTGMQIGCRSLTPGHLMVRDRNR